MSLATLPGALHWPIRAAGQPYTTPTFGVYTFTGGNTSRVRGRIRWEDAGSHTVSAIRIVVGVITTNLAAGGASVDAAVQSVGGTAWLDGGTNYGTGTRSTDLTASAGNDVTISGGSTLPHNTDIQVRLTGVGTQDWQLRGLSFDNQTHLPAHYTGTSAAQSSVPLILFTAGDGAVGVLEHIGYFETDTDTGTYKSFTTLDTDNDTVNEFGTRLTVPFAMEVTAVNVVGNVGSGVTAYELAIASLDGSNVPTLVHAQSLVRADWGSASGVRAGEIRLSAPVTLTAGVTYVITLRNRSSGNGATHTLQLGQYSIGNVSYADALPGGATYCKVSRTGGTRTSSFNTAIAYTIDTTTFIPITVKAERIDNGVGGSGGGTSPETYGGGYAG